jgi:hypothetical protein
VRRDLQARAGCQKPVTRRELLNGEQARGPQHKVKSAASTNKQSAGRAAHITAKATSAMGVPKPRVDCGGVWDAARVRGEERNTREPTVQPKSGRGSSYKPRAKSSAVQRQSEGIEVPRTLERSGGTNAVQNNAAGGKGPCGDRAGRAGKCERMADKIGPNDSGGVTPRRLAPPPVSGYRHREGLH